MNTTGQGSAAIETRGNVLALRVLTSGINPMDRADLFSVYQLGAAVHSFESVTPEMSLNEYFGIYIQGEKALDALIGPNSQVKVDLCLDAARELRAVVTRIENKYFRDEAKKWKYPDDPAKTVGYEARRLISALQNFEAVFRAEMQSASTYWVPKRGTHSTRDLVDNFERTFLPYLHETIGETALNEYRNAGRCFAFGLWTAAGYHSCRAVEAVLRPYYCKFTGKEDKEGKTWGSLIEGLETIPDTHPQPSQKTIFYLRQLKDNERNPLMHVRIVLDEQDADLLLSAAKIVMVLMAREILAVADEETKTPLLRGLNALVAS